MWLRIQQKKLGETTVWSSLLQRTKTQDGHFLASCTGNESKKPSHSDSEKVALFMISIPWVYDASRFWLLMCVCLRPEA